MACSTPSTRPHFAASASRTFSEVLGLGDVELEDVDLAVELAGGARSSG